MNELPVAAWAIPCVAILILCVAHGGPLPPISVPPPHPAVVLVLAALVWLAVLVVGARARSALAREVIR